MRLWLVFGLIAGLLLGTAAWFNFRTSRWDEIILLASERHGIDFHLVKALIYEESWFRAGIRGAAGEVGLMQVTMGAAADFCTRNGFPPIYEARLLEPRLNIEIGCWYLRHSLDHYNHSPAPTLFALLRYNAGEVRADNWLKLALSKPAPAKESAEDYYLSLVDYPTTREYARRILARARSRNYWY